MRSNSARGASATGARAIGALAWGSLATGAAAIGALAIGSLAVRRARFGRIEIGTLVIDRLEAGGERQEAPASITPIRAVPGKGDVLEGLLLDRVRRLEGNAAGYAVSRSLHDPDLFFLHGSRDGGEQPHGQWIADLRDHIAEPGGD
ncbi:MAG: hypothetical protein QM690_08770 [Sphingobium sp.]